MVIIIDKLGKGVVTVAGMNHLVAVQVAGQVTFSLGISALVSSYCIQHTR